MTSTVTVRGQTAIPVEIRRKYKIKPRTKLEWIDDGEVITVVPIPKDPIKALKGCMKDVDVSGALQQLRKEEREREDKLSF